MKEEWIKSHQPYELGYHKSEGIKWCADEKQFNQWWDEIKQWANPQGLVLDIGCGPRPPFKGYVIEPLADKYIALTPEEWWDDIVIYSQPAEEYILSFKNMFDTIVCWNCLDHTYDYKKIIDNVSSYLKDDGIFILATDIRKPCLGHPSFPKEEFMQEINKLFNIIEKKEHFKQRELCLKLSKKLVL